ncbi:MAG: hypothetical protein ACOCWM_05480 [Cyclobacteriaceae bacterium]
MKNFLIFFGGFVVGILATLLFLFLISIGVASNNSENELQFQYSENEVQAQYIEVKGKKGNVTLHTGMSKDTVQMLVGKPDETDLYEMFNTYHEKWGYRLKNEYISDLEIDFEDGKLKGVRQN